MASSPHQAGQGRGEEVFAGCLDLLDVPGQGIGEQLLAHAQDKGLAGIPFDEQAVWRNERATLIQQRQWHTPESRLEKEVMGDNYSRILFWGRIDNRPELISELGDTADSELVKTDTGLVLNAWKRWGAECCSHLVGDFAFVIYQPESDQLFLARDHFGVKPLYFWRTSSQLVFATSLAVLAELKHLKLKASREWMARFVLGISPDWRHTAYELVEKIQPAHSLLWSTAEPDLAQEAWYEFQSPHPLELQSEGAYIRAYRDCFHRAVRDRVRCGTNLGAECSGGLDSSSICASVARQLSAATASNPDDSFDLFAVALSRDEPEAIRRVADKVQHRNLHEFGVDSEMTLSGDVEKQYLEVAGCPPEHGNAIAQQPFYLKANENNVDVILSGFGGDEFSTNYATTALVELWQQRKWRLWALRFRGNWLGRALRMVKWLLRYFLLGPGTETARRLQKIAKKTWAMKPLRASVISPGLKELLIQRSRYDSGARTLNEFVLGDRLSPQIGARLESCTLFAARYGIEYRWPMLDIRLIEFFLAVPVEQKLGEGGIGRYLHRRAMVDLLPPELIWRDKDMGPSIEEKSEIENNNNINLNNELSEIVNPESINSLQVESQSGKSNIAHIAHTFLARISLLEACEPTGDNHSEPTGDNHSEPTGNNHSEPTGDNHSEPTGNNHSEPTGDNHNEPSGKSRVEPNK